MSYEEIIVYLLAEVQDEQDKEVARAINNLYQLVGLQTMRDFET